MSNPVICFGQQPCGFFPRRFLYAKFETARRLQAEQGGEIVFFFHDSDHDPRETQTILRHRKRIVQRTAASYEEQKNSKQLESQSRAYGLAFCSKVRNSEITPQRGEFWQKTIKLLLLIPA